MRQYCGTSAKYEGLYRVIATGDIPGASETRKYTYDFPAVERPEGIVGQMVVISRANDNIEALGKRTWAADPDHPDVDAVNEASKLFQAFEAICELGEVKNGPQDQADWFVSSREDSRKLRAELERVKAGEAAAAEAASKTFKAIQDTCNDCHAVYRN
jgi:hypothetical protein